jgi:hypothetical protein
MNYGDAVTHDSGSYRQFLKKHPNGHLNVNDFVDMFPLGVAKAVFRAVDTNIDGRVSFEEYLLALKALEGSEDQWLECTSTWPIISWLSRRWSVNAGLFRLFDMSGDDRISCDEVQAIFEATDETSDEQGETTEMASFNINVVAELSSWIARSVRKRWSRRWIQMAMACWR